MATDNSNKWSPEKQFLMREPPFTPEGGYGKTIAYACAGAFALVRKAIEELEVRNDSEAAVQLLLVVRDYLLHIEEFDETEDEDDEEGGDL